MPGMATPANPATANSEINSTFLLDPENIDRFNATFAPQNMRTASMATRRNQAMAAPVKP
ncbi:hypothetical protein D3C71_1625470 [compost metagenome]